MRRCSPISQLTFDNLIPRLPVGAVTMSRPHFQIVLVNNKPKRVSNSDLALAAIIDDRCGYRGSCTLTRRQIAEEFGCVPSYVRQVVRHAEQNGIVTSHEEFRADGSQAGNRYRLTRFGRAALEACNRDLLRIE